MAITYTERRRLDAMALVIELFARLDRGDITAAMECYADDAIFMGATGRAAIEDVVRAGLAPNASKRTRHVIGNLRASMIDNENVRVEYTAVTYTLDGAGPFAPRSVLDQCQEMRVTPDGNLVIARHEIPDYR